MSGLGSLPENHRITLNEALDLWLERDGYEEGSVTFDIARRANSEILIKAYHDKAFEWEQGYKKSRYVRSAGIGVAPNQSRRMIKDTGQSTVLAGEFLRWLREKEQETTSDQVSNVSTQDPYPINSIYVIFSLLVDVVCDENPIDQARNPTSARSNTNVVDENGVINFTGLSNRLSEVAQSKLIDRKSGLGADTLTRDYETGITCATPEHTGANKRKNLIRSCFLLYELYSEKNARDTPESLQPELLLKLRERKNEHRKLANLELTQKLLSYCVTYERG